MGEIQYLQNPRNETKIRREIAGGGVGMVGRVGQVLPVLPTSPTCLLLLLCNPQVDIVSCVIIACELFLTTYTKQVCHNTAFPGIMGHPSLKKRLLCMTTLVLIM